MTLTLKKSICIAVLLYCENTLVNGQPSTRKIEVGVLAGTYLSQGDLTPYRMGSIKTPGYGLMVFAGKAINRSFSLRGNLALGKIKSDDAAYASPLWRKQRSYRFQTPLLEFSAVLVWDLLRTNGSYFSRGFSPYLFGGAGFTFLHISRSWNNFNPEYFAPEPQVQAQLNKDIAHVLPSAIPVLPLGVGVRYGITPKMGIVAEAAYRLTATDYVDGFTNSVTASRRDAYSSAFIGVVYKLGIKGAQDCPPVPR